MPKKGELPVWLKRRKKIGRVYKGKDKNAKRVVAKRTRWMYNSINEKGDFCITFNKTLLPEPCRPKRKAASDAEVERKRQCVHGSADLEGRPVLSPEARRIAISYAFVEKYGAPFEEEWFGEGGTISLICKDLGIPDGSRNSVKAVLQRTVDAIADGGQYDGERIPGGGRKPLIPPGSVFEQIVADGYENGMGTSTITATVNKELRDCGMQTVGRSAVLNCFHRLCPNVTAIDVVKQGVDDEESAWCKASRRWVVQLLARITGKQPSLAELKEWRCVDDDDDSIPKCFDVSVLQPIPLSKVAWRKKGQQTLSTAQKNCLINNPPGILSNHMKNSRKWCWR